MLDPRIYRTGLLAVALAVVVFAFSLYDQPGSFGTTLAPDAFNGQNAFSTMTQLAAAYPHRPPGSGADQAIAAMQARQFRRDGFLVTSSRFSARTVDGTRTLENVVATKPGLTAGSIVIVAHRDAVGSPATADLSGAGVLLELARVLSGETQHRTVVLASTSGSQGAAGATQLARQLGHGADAVIVLGDLAGARVRGELVAPWSNAQKLAPGVLRNTVAAALGLEAGLPPGQTSIGGQFAHLAFPIAAGEQAPFDARGQPAVLLSTSGERPPAANEPISLAQITALGRTVLQSINALDGSPPVPPSSVYLSYSGKVIPAWAVRLLVLALILPVLFAAVDGLARARRRGNPMLRWLIWGLAGAVPFLLGLAVIAAFRMVGLIRDAPPGPMAGGAVAVSSKAVVVLVLLAVVIALGLLVLRPLLIRLAKPHGPRSPREPPGAGAAAALLVLLCGASLAIWFSDPYAAVLLVPALHLWIWVVEPTVRLRASVVAGLVLAGLALPVVAVVYWATTLGHGLVGAAWNGVLLVAGGGVGTVATIEWSVIGGCAVGVILTAWNSARELQREESSVTVRGPVTYAGPGSLGGTESALRR